MWNKILSYHSSNNLIFSKTKHYIKKASYESSLCQLYHDRCDTVYRYTHIIAHKCYMWILSHYRKHTECPCLTAKFCRYILWMLFAFSMFACRDVRVNACFLLFTFAFFPHLSRHLQDCTISGRSNPNQFPSRTTAIDQSLG